ncbi:MAG: restriction endonuclease subunit S [Methanosphaera sp.]|nr:restriction endonuclease subunit S [Methanosphaera sp.]
MKNNNLEQLSNNIFRQYFILYEFPDNEGKPYKSNGGKFISTEYGEIPERWNIIKLKEICKFIKGKKPKNIEEKYFEDSKEYLTIDVLQGNEKLYGSKEKTIPINKYDILMVMDGASSGDLFYGKNGILGSTLAKIKVKEEYLEIIYKYLDYYNEEIKRNNTGSAIPHTDKGFVLNLKIAVPSDLDSINTIFRNIRDKTIKNNQEIEKLTKLRDTLLPKLMSGEIDVSGINFD